MSDTTHKPTFHAFDTQSVEFDWDAIEPEHIPEIDEQIKKATAFALAKFARTILTVGGNSQRQFFIAANCLAFAAHLHPSQDKTGEQIAKTIKLTKANFFRRVNQFRDVLKLPRIAGAWKDDARKSIKSATKQHHEKRKQQTPKQSGIAARIAAAHSATGSAN